MKNAFMIMVLLLCIAPLVSASSPIRIYEQGDSMMLVTGVQQMYSVVFDGEGEAIVTAKLILSNRGDITIHDFNIELPGDVQVLGVAIARDTQTCIQWEDTCAERGASQTCVQYDYQGNCVEWQSPCLRQERTCAQYNYGAPGYERVSVEPQRLSASTNLPLEVDLSPNNQAEVLIAYKARGFTSDALGATHFAFETAKVAFDTQSVRVGISVQDGLKIKGGSSGVNYQSVLEMSSAMASKDIAGIAPYQYNIGYGSYTKSATYLDPQESFTVEGVYSGSTLRLYWGRILLTILLLAGLVWGARVAFRKLSDAMPAPDKKQVKSGFAVPTLAGFVSTLSIAFLWGVIWLLVVVADNLFRGGAEALFIVAFIILGCIATLALLVGTPIYVGSRYGSSAGGFTVLSQIAWIFLFTLIGFLIAGIFMVSRSTVIY